MYKSLIKPIADSLLALLAFIILSPVFTLVCIFLLIANDGKPFFTQIRPGKNSRLFNIIKFKTMNDRKYNNGELLPDEQRLTKIGKFVRKTSLDELPQLLNVIKGDMSFIGPRPLLPEYLPFYSKEQARRHEVKPGITGWAQVNGRNAISWEKKFEYDLWYVNNQSFALDFQIFVKTFKKVLKSEGIVEGATLTNSKFTGN
jgi:lipopolysaccharide/colanic/teichoic acid biosynthesis glycosyltransferase